MVDAPATDPAPVAEAEAQSGSGHGSIDQVLDRLAAVEAQLGEFHARSVHRESVIDRLHAENRELREGLRRSLLEPVVTDLIRLHDAIGRDASAQGDERLASLLGSYASDVELILDRCGMEAFRAEPGDAYRPGEHRPVAVVPVPDLALDNTVVEVVAIGFRERDSGRVRRPVRARFHQYRPPSDGRPLDEPASG
jgi:molecular chaperone GrpE (heat shock protein)